MSDRLRGKHFSGLKFEEGTKPFEGGTTLRRCVFSDCDFSGCDLRALDAMHCRFERVSFEGANLGGFQSGGNRYIDCSFTKARLRGADLGAPWPDRFASCRFVEASLVDTGLHDSQFDDCTFNRCIYKGASRQWTEVSLERCAFIGTLDSLTFGSWEYGASEHPLRLRVFGGLRRNAMSEVDFSNAVVWGCSFIGGLDLATAHLPRDGRHAYYRQWPTRVDRVLDATVSGAKEVRQGFLDVFLHLGALDWQGDYISPDWTRGDLIVRTEQEQFIVSHDWIRETAPAAASLIIERLGTPDRQ